MNGVYDFRNECFVCTNETGGAVGEVVVKYEGNLFLDKRAENELLHRIAAGHENGRIFREMKGQFAIAVMEKNTKTLLLVRDQLGQVPLYYFIGKDRVAFGTTISSILKELEKDAVLNGDVVHEYFMFGYISGRNTFFGDVFEVKPGSMVRIDNAGRSSEEEYFALRYSSEFERNGSDSHGMFQEAFRNSLSLQTHDKDKTRIGVLSSGGLDSSILVSHFRGQTGHSFRTYYVGFEGYEHNRLKEVNDVSGRCHTDQKNVLIPNKEYSDHLIDTIKINEEPLNHPCSVALECLYERIHGETDVLLSGEGADCLYCGYFIYNLINWLYVNNPAGWLTPAFGKIAGPLFRGGRGRGKAGKVMGALMLSPDVYTMRYGDFACNNAEDVGNLLMSRLPVAPGKNYVSGFSNGSKRDVLDQILKIYQTHYLVEGLNTSNKLGDHFGIEIRYPFIDIELVRLFNSFSWKERIELLRRKHQIYAVAERCLPKEVVDKPKEGFGVPLDSWFYDEKGLGRFVGLLNDKRTRERGVFKVDYLDKLLEKYQQRRLRADSFEFVFWPIINFELWNRIFIDKKAIGY